LPAAEFQELYDKEMAAARAERIAKAELEANQRFYNQPSAAADISFWSKATFWTLEEGVGLALGKSPYVVNEKALSSLVLLGSPFVGRTFKFSIWRRERRLPGISQVLICRATSSRGPNASTVQLLRPG
jgi:hypothetical protein